MNKKKNYIIMTKNSSYATTQVIMDNCKTQFNHSLVYLSITWSQWYASLTFKTVSFCRQIMRWT